MTTPTAEVAMEAIYEDSGQVTERINSFCASTFKTRGGRLGSGMGLLLEALWIYFMNETLANEGGEARLCELAWMPDHQPADFACLIRGADWDPVTRSGELFRIEAKSMNRAVIEAKGHFTNLKGETEGFDQLLVIIWEWVETENQYFSPQVVDYFLGSQMQIIHMRDELHKARGGTFVSSAACPDECDPALCQHDGEPLNAAGKRERPLGPTKTKPANVNHAANFGGLLRMIKTSGASATSEFRRIRKECDVAHSFISFVHRNFPKEEVSQYKKDEWLRVAKDLEVDLSDKTPIGIRDSLFNSALDYQACLREII